MDGQQLDVADAGHIVTRDLAPPRTFSFFKEGVMAWGLVSLPIFILIVTVIGTKWIPTEWALVTALGLGGFAYYALSIWAFAALHAWKPFAAARRIEAEEALNALAVHPLLHWDADVGHAESDQVRWATGIGWDGHFLYVLDKGVGARIPPSKVREWRWVANRAGAAAWVGSAGGVGQTWLAQQQVHDFNLRNNWRVNADNGLLVSVRDVDRPMWRFQTSDERILRKWDELLSQVFEGQAPPLLPAGADSRGEAAYPRTKPLATGTAPAKGGPGKYKVLGVVLLGVLLAAVAVAVVSEVVREGANPFGPNAYMSGSLADVRTHIRRQAWGSDAGALDLRHNLDSYEQVRGRDKEALLNRSLLAYSLAMPAGNRKREFLRTFCKEVLSQELMGAFAASGHRDDLLRVIVFVSPEGNTFDNGKLLSPQVLAAVSRERAWLPSLASLRRCNETIPFGVE